jgi:hypothetical protein
MCNLYSITTNQEAISRLCRVINRYVGNLAPMPGVFPDYPAPVVRNKDTGRELTMMRWGMPPPPDKPPVPQTNIRSAGWDIGSSGSLGRIAGASFRLTASQSTRRSRTRRRRKRILSGSRSTLTGRCSPSPASGRPSIVIAAPTRSRCRGRIRSTAFSRHPRTRWSSRSIRRPCR